jgi:hypothetical protein
MNLPPITPNELKVLAIAFESGLPNDLAQPLIDKGLLMRCPPHLVLTEEGRALLIYHAAYKPFLLQRYEGGAWLDSGRTWTEAGAYGLYAKSGAIWRECEFRILDEERKVIFTTEHKPQSQEIK